MLFFKTASTNFAISKHLDTSNTNMNSVSKEDAKMPFASYNRSERDNRIDRRGDRKLPATQTSFQIQKPCETNVIEAKSKAKGQLAKNATATTTPKAASKYVKHAGADEGSEFVRKTVHGGPALKKYALAPTQKQNVASASSQYYIEKLAVDARSRNRKERKKIRRTNKNNSAACNHQRIVNYTRKKKLPISQNINDISSDGVDVSHGDEAALEHTKYVGEKEGSKFDTKTVPGEQTLKDSALVPNHKQNVARAFSQFYIEKLAVDAQSRNRKKRKTSQRTNNNNSVVCNHQRIVNYVRSKRDFKKKIPISQNTGERNSDDVDVSQVDGGRNHAEHLQEALHENDRVSRPGAFAVSGIGGEGGNNTWESTQDVQSEVDDSMVEEESEYFAAVVDDETLHENFRENILTNEVTIADDVVPTDEYLKKEKRQCLLWAFGVLSVLGTVIGVSIGLTRTNESESTVSEFPSASPTLVPTRTMIPTLDTIQNNGKVRCGIGSFDNFETDLCRALAAAVLGDPEKIDLVTHSFASRWEALANESIDVYALPSTYTMARDVYQKDAKAGFTFSAPVLYDGVVFGGIPEYVDCADRLDTYFGNCSQVRICVNMGASSHDLLADNVADFNLRPVENYEMFLKGKCNVVASPSFLVAEPVLRMQGYTGDYKVGKTVLLGEPYSMVTREDDKMWSDFVNWVFRSLLAAEEQSITQNTASKFTTTTVFGDKYKDMFVNAIQAVGNYGDLYRRHREHLVPRDSLKFNLLNNGSTGLHFAYPLGKATEGPDPIASSTIHFITKKEGKLRCGIFDREGFGKEIVSTRGTRWQGMDADYCYALSASLFGGDANKVVFVNVTKSVDGFQALDNGLVDVVAGVPWTLEGDVNETSTGKGYTFSMPYFYGDANDPLVQDNVSVIPAGALSLVTREDDSQWSDFVFWVVSATFIAEEEYITQKMSKDMIGVSVFGPSFVDMHRHAIGAVGNYGEIYSRNVESVVPRQGRNLLNSNPLGPQQFSFF